MARVWDNKDRSKRKYPWSVIGMFAKRSADEIREFHTAENKRSHKVIRKISHYLRMIDGSKQFRNERTSAYFYDGFRKFRIAYDIKTDNFDIDYDRHIVLIQVSTCESDWNKWGDSNIGFYVFSYHSLAEFKKCYDYYKKNFWLKWKTSADYDKDNPIIRSVIRTMKGLGWDEISKMGVVTEDWTNHD